MTTPAISRLNKKYDVVIHNQQKFSGTYKMSFDMHTNFGTATGIMVNQKQTMSEVIEFVLERLSSPIAKQIKLNLESDKYIELPDDEQEIEKFLLAMRKNRKE